MIQAARVERPRRACSDRSRRSLDASMSPAPRTSSDIRSSHHSPGNNSLVVHRPGQKERVERNPEVGDFVEIWWDDDKTYYRGRLLGRRGRDGNFFHIKYDDSDRETVDLNTETWKFSPFPQRFESDPEEDNEDGDSSFPEPPQEPPSELQIFIRQEQDEKKKNAHEQPESTEKSRNESTAQAPALPSEGNGSRPEAQSLNREANFYSNANPPSSKQTQRRRKSTPLTRAQIQESMARARAAKARKYAATKAAAARRALAHVIATKSEAVEKSQNEHPRNDHSASLRKSDKKTEIESDVDVVSVRNVESSPRTRSQSKHSPTHATSPPKSSRVVEDGCLFVPLMTEVQKKPISLNGNDRKDTKLSSDTPANEPKSALLRSNEDQDQNPDKIKPVSSNKAPITNAVALMTSPTSKSVLPLDGAEDFKRKRSSNLSPSKTSKHLGTSKSLPKADPKLDNIPLKDKPSLPSIEPPQAVLPNKNVTGAKSKSSDMLQALSVPLTVHLTRESQRRASGDVIDNFGAESSTGTFKLPSTQAATDKRACSPSQKKLSTAPDGSGQRAKGTQPEKQAAGKSVVQSNATGQKWIKNVGYKINSRRVAAENDIMRHHEGSSSEEDENSLGPAPPRKRARVTKSMKEHSGKPSTDRGVLVQKPFRKTKGSRDEEANDSKLSSSQLASISEVVATTLNRQLGPLHRNLSTLTMTLQRLSKDLERDTKTVVDVKTTLERTGKKLMEEIGSSRADMGEFRSEQQEATATIARIISSVQTTLEPSIQSWVERAVYRALGVRSEALAVIHGVKEPTGTSARQTSLRGEPISSRANGPSNETGEVKSPRVPLTSHDLCIDGSRPARRFEGDQLSRTEMRTEATRERPNIDISKSLPRTEERSHVNNYREEGVRSSSQLGITQGRNGIGRQMSIDLHHPNSGFGTRVCNIVARQAIVCLLQTPHEIHDATSSDLWAKQTSAWVYSSVSEHLSEFTSYAQAYHTLSTSLGYDAVELTWFLSPENESALIQARRNYAAWDPPPSDDEWKNEMVLLREVAEGYHRAADRFRSTDGMSELASAVALSNLAKEMYHMDGYYAHNFPHGHVQVRESGSTPGTQNRPAHHPS